MKTRYKMNHSKYKKKWYKSLTLLTALLVSNGLMAQNVAYDWAGKLGGNANDNAKAIAVDGNGNVYSTGAYASSSSDFDPGNGTSNLSTNGAFDIYVSKLDASGDFVWAKGIGGTGFDFGYDICVDGAGNAYVTGSFSGTVDFDPGTGVSNLTSAGSYDIFVLKLNATGDFVWAKSFGAAATDEGHAIQVDGAGNVFTAGLYSGTVDFNPGSAVNNLTSVNGASDAFISKLDASGNFVWAKSFGGNSYDKILDFKLDAAGNIYLTGSFRGTVDFDPGTGVANLTSVNGAQDVFVAKLNALGNYVWAKGFGGTGDDVGFSIALDAANNIYTAGEFSETADFDPGVAFQNITAYGSADAYVSKLNASGNFLWARKLGGTDFDRANGIATDLLGNVYIIGEYKGTADFDPGKGTKSFTEKGFNDIFMVKLSTLGTYLWAQSYGSSLEDKGLSVCIDGSGNVYATGHFMVSVYFDPGVSQEYISTSGGMDAFILKLSCTATHSTETVTTCNPYVFDGKTYTESNNTATRILTNAVGCDSIITLDLTINSIDVSTTISEDTIKANIIGATYQWINCSKGNAVVAGATDASFIPATDGEYAVIITFKGCADTSDCVNVNTVGVHDMNIVSFELYPNPATSSVTISNFSPMMRHVAILDLTGKVLQSFTPETAEIDLKMLQNGIYLIKVQYGNEVFTKRIIKM